MKLTYEEKLIELMKSNFLFYSFDNFTHLNSTENTENAYSIWANKGDDFYEEGCISLHSVFYLELDLFYLYMDL